MNKVYIIGGANIDIIGSSLKPLLVHDSNPGKISLSFGGVGRNISENLALLKEDIYFCSIFSNDSFGKMMIEDLEKKGINICYSKVVSNYNSSIYLAILDEKKDMYLGMSDMDILDELDIETIDKMIKNIDNKDTVVLDTNLNENIIKHICYNSKGLIVVDPISARKSHKIKEVLNYIDIFKPNKYEAESISGIYINDIETANSCIDYFLKKGVKELVITLGSEGVIAANNMERYWLYHDYVEVVNATGGGDAFLSAYVKSRINNEDIINSAKYAIGSAVCTVKSLDTVNQMLCDSIIYEELNNLNIKEESLCI
ncbi:MAG: kinase [Erysipelotrichaceae bacterium]|nr:kinase [Erysipelotrichaceae bacterium]